MTTAFNRDTLKTTGEQLLITWDALAKDETGDAVSDAAFADRTVQVSGVFGGATVVLEGSNDGIKYFTLHDPFSNLISFTGDGLKGVTELPHFVRPRVTGGDVTTSVAVTLFARREA